MGAQEFTEFVYGEDSPEKAFAVAVERAAWEHGHGGYTGTIAEKTGFLMVDDMWAGENPPTVDEALGVVDRAYEDEDHIAQGKWGPAACLTIKGGHLFFGYASS